MTDFVLPYPPGYPTVPYFLRITGTNQIIRTDRIKNNKKNNPVKVMQLTKDDIIIKIHESVNEAARELEINPSNIFACLNINRHEKTAGGYKWRRI